MGKPITTTSGGICFAFPDVCYTPPTTLASPPGIPIPYPNIGQLTDVENMSDNVNANNNPVVRADSSIAQSTGDEAGSLGGVNPASGTTKGKIEFTSASATVLVNGQGVIRMFDTTSQNKQNAVGIVLGGVPTVLVGD